jgi:hypothetical protein
MWLLKAIIAVIHRVVVGGNGPGAFRPDQTARLAEIVEYPKSDTRRGRELVPILRDDCFKSGKS